MEVQVSLGAFLIFIFNSYLANGFVVAGPLYGRNFGGLFSGTFPFRRTTQTQLSTLSDRVSVVENAFIMLGNQVASTNNQVMALVNQIAPLNSLNSQLSILSNAVANLQTGQACPSSAPNAKFVGSLCYFVVSTGDTFTNAKAACITKGGSLAEPLFGNSATFYTSMKITFPTEINTIGATGEFWIGLVQPATTTPTTTPFAYLVSNIQVTPTTATFNVAPTSMTTAGNAAVFVAPGGVQWKFYDISSNILKPYICQINPV